MAKISRFLLKVFGGDGPDNDFGEFGSKAAGVPLKTKNVDLIQALAAWPNGWRDAILTGDRLPALEDMNSAFFVHSKAMAYMFQEGIPEWQAGTTYYIGSFVKKTGTAELYVSLVDENVGNALPSQADNANWRYVNLFPASDITGAIKEYAGSTEPSGYYFCRGQEKNRVTDAALFAVIGTTFGPGNGSTTFNLPDRQGRVGVGKAASGTFATLGATGGNETHTHTQAAHGHTVDSHTHDITHTHTGPAHTHSTPRDGWGVATRAVGRLTVGVNVSGTDCASADNTTGSSGTGVTSGPSTSNSGSASPGTNSVAPTIDAASSLQPYLVTNFIIKY